MEKNISSYYLKTIKLFPYGPKNIIWGICSTILILLVIFGCRRYLNNRSIQILESNPLSMAVIDRKFTTLEIKFNQKNVSKLIKKITLTIGSKEKIINSYELKDNRLTIPLGEYIYCGESNIVTIYTQYQSFKLYYKGKACNNVISTNPSNGTKFVQLNQKIFLTFNDVLTTNSSLEKYIHLYDTKGKRYNIHVQQHKSEMIIAPDDIFDQGELFTLFIESGFFKEINELSVRTPHSFILQFVTKPSANPILDDWKSTNIAFILNSLKYYSNGLTEIGKSISGVPIYLIKFGTGMKKILLVGGHHGYEEETAIVSLYLANYYARNQSSIPQTFAIWIIPALNPDGLNKSQRNNINGVDLNRNYQTSNWIKSEKDIFYSGPSPFSEPETNAIKELLEKEKFMFVISLHTNLDYFESNSFSNRYGNLNLFLSKISQKVGYNFFDASIIPISDIITKGEFTTWLTETHNTPAITIEMKTEPNYDSFIKIRTLIEELIPWIGN